jgi:predicted metalloprotease
MLMTKRSAVTTAALSVLALFIAGCVLPTPDDPGTDGTTVKPSKSAEPDPSFTSLEGAFTYETMDEYVEIVVPWITDWIEHTWPSMRLPTVVFVEHGDSGRSGCVDVDGRAARFDDESYFYCGPDETIYVGQDTVWLFYDETGDAGPAMGLAHEFGHHIQHQLRVPSPRTSEQSIDYENQADCLSGAWIGFMDGESTLGSLEPEDDLKDINKLMPMIASAEDDIDRDHGTLAERKAAFNAGYQRGVTACGVQAG